MKHTHHPCGALPIDGFNLSVWWCEHHQAFWASSYTYRQDTSTDEPEMINSGFCEFGPFDTLTDVQRWIRGEWDAWRLTP